MSNPTIDNAKALSKILQNLGKYKQMLEHEEIPLEIVGMQVNPTFSEELGVMILALGINFAIPNRELALDEVRYIVSEKKK